MSDIEERGRSLRSAAAGISYSPMLERLKAQRQPPSLELEHTPGGTTEQSVHRQVSEERETRITQMEHRLFREAHGHAVNEFAVSQLRGHATRDFGHER